jgi:hypothetical protein
MATEARIGWGGELWLATDNTEATLTELAEVRNVGFPQIEVDEHEVTHLKSPDRFKEYISGLKDGGEFTATTNYDPGSATDLLLTAALGSTTRMARIVIPDDSGAGTADWNMTFPVIVKRYAPDSMEPNAPITATATFRVAGAVEQGTGEAGS